MRMRSAGSWMLLSLVVLARTPGRAQEDPQNAHGRFTGEIKPVLYVLDVENSAPFYRDVLGFDLEGFADSHGRPYYAEMAAAGVKFGLHEPTATAQRDKVGKQRLYFRVEDLRAHYSRVRARGGEPGKIVETAWMDFFVVRDPDGNEIAFAETDPDRHTSDPWRVDAPAGAGCGKSP